MFKPIIIFTTFLYMLCMLTNMSVNAQGTVKGRICNQLDTIGKEVEILIPQNKMLVSSNFNGYFEIQDIPLGRTVFLIQDGFQIVDSFIINVKDSVINIGSLYFSFSNSPHTVDNNEVILTEESGESDDDNFSSNSPISYLLTTSGKREAIANAINFSFMPYSFKARGYDKLSQTFILNGIKQNDLINGGSNASQWADFSPMYYESGYSYGLNPHLEGLGSLSGLQFFQINAAQQNQGVKLSYTNANKSYRHKISVQYNSEVSKSNWAYTIYAMKKWANESYYPGTNTNGLALGLTIAKSWKEKSQLLFTIIGNQNETALNTLATQELYSLAQSNYYNPNWGYQNQDKRNTSIRAYSQPMFMLQHLYNLSERSKLSTSISYGLGNKSISGLDWYNAIDPRADYYKNLPSAYIQNDSMTAATIRQNIISNPQLIQTNWKQLYEANLYNIETLQNSQGLITGKRSLYVVANNVESYHKWAFNSNMKHRINYRSILSCGVDIQYQKSYFYREIEDLLGGDYFLNYNMFANQQSIYGDSLKQFDLLKPDRAISLHERYRYNYSINVLESSLWAQLIHDSKYFNFHLSSSVGYKTYQREGFYQNGIFSLNSLGKSNLLQNFLYQIKGGIQYKINGRNYLLLNIYNELADQGVNNSFISPRIHNLTLDNNKNINRYGLEASYVLQAPKLYVKTTGYISAQNNLNTIHRFFNDDPNVLGFTNFVMQGVNIKNIGTEIALDYAINSFFNTTIATTLGQTFYTNNPHVTLYLDNDTSLSTVQKNVSIKNYYAVSGPQSAYSLGLTYNSKKFWNLSINANYFDRNFVQINPNRRSSEAVNLLDPSSVLYNQIINEERLPAFYTINIKFSKSLLLSKVLTSFTNKQRAYVYVGIQNVLNNQNIMLYGREQLRYNFTDNNPNTFANKYLFASGRTYWAGVSFKF